MFTFYDDEEVDQMPDFNINYYYRKICLFFRKLLRKTHHQNKNLKNPKRMNKN